MADELYDLRIICGDHETTLNKIKPNRYSYLDLVNDVFGALSKIPNIKDKYLIYKCGVADDEYVRMILSSDSDVLQMFSLNKGRKYINIFVSIKELPWKSCDTTVAREDNVEKGNDIKSGVGGKVELKKGDMFADVTEFRYTLKDYAIQEGFEVVRVKNEKVRVTAKCKGEGCLWRVHASLLPGEKTFMVKRINSEHSCVRTNPRKEASARWMGTKLVDVLRENPEMKYSGLKNELNKYGLDPPYYKVQRAKHIAMDIIEAGRPKKLRRHRLVGGADTVKRSGLVNSKKCNKFGHNERTYGRRSKSNHHGRRNVRTHGETNAGGETTAKYETLPSQQMNEHATGTLCKESSNPQRLMEDIPLAQWIKNRKEGAQCQESSNPQRLMEDIPLAQWIKNRKEGAQCQESSNPQRLMEDIPLAQWIKNRKEDAYLEDGIKKRKKYAIQGLLFMQK